MSGEGKIGDKMQHYYPRLMGNVRFGDADFDTYKYKPMHILLDC